MHRPRLREGSVQRTLLREVDIHRRYYEKGGQKEKTDFDHCNFDQTRVQMANAYSKNEKNSDFSFNKAYI